MPHSPQKLSPATIAVLLALAAPVYSLAETPAAQSFNLPAQTLSNSLQQFAQQTRTQVLFAPALLQGKTSAPLSGTLTPRQALDKLLSGTGLKGEIGQNGTIVIKPDTQPKQKTTPSEQALDNVKVSATQRQQAFAETVISKQELRISRGTGNADIFSGQPQVQVNNIRNEAGALDVGIRNMQGEGRVPVIIDGALQSTHTGRGYMGTADRTYIDSDLISSARVNVGASQGAFSSGAVAGLVKIQTLEASDILKEGEKAGLLIKGSMQNNNQTPDIPANAKDQSYYIVKNKSDGDHFHNGSLTLAAALRHERGDAVLAYSKRRTGNYFAGTRGYDVYLENKDEWSYPPVNPGMEVVNTSFDSDSLLAKFSFRPDSEQQLKLTYRKHNQEAGEVLSAYWYRQRNDKNFKPLPSGQFAMPQWGLGSANVQTLSTHYTLTSNDNPLINLSIGLWGSDAKMKQRNGLVSAIDKPKNGDQFLHYYSNRRHGFNLINIAEIPDLGLTLQTGVATQTEHMRPDSKASWNNIHAARNAIRKERSLFTHADWQLGSLNLQAGANLHKAQIDDRANLHSLDYGSKLDWQLRASSQITPWLQLFAGTSLNHRNPSLHEGSSSAEMYQYRPDHPIKAERVNNREIGAELNFAHLNDGKTQLQIKASYFDNRAKNYITQAVLDEQNWLLGHDNYDLFHNRGTELVLNFKHNAFFFDANTVFYRPAAVCSAEEAAKVNRSVDQWNSRPWNQNHQKPYASDCNSMGFAWSLIPSRIQPERKFVFTTGLNILENQLKIGSRLRYHSGKKNPREWLAGTGASAIVDIPSSRLIDVFAEYRLDKNTMASLHVDNLRNHYTIDAGQLITMPTPGRTIRLGFEAKF